MTVLGITMMGLLIYLVVVTYFVPRTMDVVHVRDQERRGRILETFNINGEIWYLTDHLEYEHVMIEAGRQATLRHDQKYAPPMSDDEVEDDLDSDLKNDNETISHFTKAKNQRTPPSMRVRCPHVRFEQKHHCATCSDLNTIIERIRQVHLTFGYRRFDTFLIGGTQWTVDRFTQRPYVCVNEIPGPVWVCDNRERMCTKKGDRCYIRHDARNGHFLITELRCEDEDRQPYFGRVRY